MGYNHYVDRLVGCEEQCLCVCSGVNGFVAKREKKRIDSPKVFKLLLMGFRFVYTFIVFHFINQF